MCKARFDPGVLRGKLWRPHGVSCKGREIWGTPKSNYEADVGQPGITSGAEAPFLLIVSGTTEVVPFPSLRFPNEVVPSRAFASRLSRVLSEFSLPD